MGSVELGLAIVGAWAIISLVVGGLLVAARAWHSRRAASAEKGQATPDTQAAQEPHLVFALRRRVEQDVDPGSRRIKAS
jgi:hypothetical protein